MNKDFRFVNLFHQLQSQYQKLKTQNKINTTQVNKNKYRASESLFYKKSVKPMKFHYETALQCRVSPV